VIRKILFFTIVIFTIIWFALAYTVKYKLVNLIKNLNNENIQISYDHVKISGYPTSYDIHIINPKLKILTTYGETELFTEKLSLQTNIGFKTINIIFSKNLKQMDVFDGKLVEYNVDEASSIKLKFAKALYRISQDDNFVNILEDIDIKSELLSVIRDDLELFSISNLIISSNKQILNENDAIHSNIHFIYNAQQELLNFQNAQFDLEYKYSINNINRQDKSIDIIGLNFLAGASTIKINGTINLANKTPQAILNFEVGNYNDILDKIFNKNSLISNNFIKFFLKQSLASILKDDHTKISDESLQEPKDIKFILSLSNEGIKINSYSLNELLLNNKLDNDSSSETE
jgi:hypothetical protein